jgi:hypothetical protein
MRPTVPQRFKGLIRTEKEVTHFYKATAIPGFRELERFYFINDFSWL